MPKQPERTTKTVPSPPSSRAESSPGPPRLKPSPNSSGRSSGRAALSRPPWSGRRRAGRYEIVAGHQRWLAAKEAWQKTIRVEVVPLDDKEAALWMLTENVHRSDPSAMEEAELYWKVARLFNKTEPPPRRGKPGGGSTPHYLSAQWAAALLPPATWGRPRIRFGRSSAARDVSGTLPSTTSCARPTHGWADVISTKRTPCQDKRRPSSENRRWLCSRLPPLRTEARDRGPENWAQVGASDLDKLRQTYTRLG